jgi:hypothetical protein
MLSISPSVVFKRVGDEAVLLDFERGVYYGLDEVGARVWELIADGRSIDAVAQVMTEEYEVAFDDVRRDVETLIVELEKNGLVTG